MSDHHPCFHATFHNSELSNKIMFQVCATSCPPTLFKCSILYSSDGLQQWRGWKTHSGQQTLETLREIHVATIISKFRLVIKMWHLSLLAKQIWLKMHLFGQSTNWNKNVSFTDSIHPPPTHPPTHLHQVKMTSWGQPNQCAKKHIHHLSSRQTWRPGPGCSKQY